MWRVIGFRAVIAVAHIVKSDVVAIDLRPAQFSNVGLPVPIVTGRQGSPPDEDDEKTGENQAELAPESAHKNDRGQGQEEKAKRSRLPEGSERKIVVERAEGPEQTKSRDDPE